MISIVGKQFPVIGGKYKGDQCTVLALKPVMVEVRLSRADKITDIRRTSIGWKEGKTSSGMDAKTDMDRDLLERLAVVEEELSQGRKRLVVVEEALKGILAILPLSRKE